MESNGDDKGYPVLCIDLADAAAPYSDVVHFEADWKEGMLTLLIHLDHSALQYAVSLTEEQARMLARRITGRI